ncbi:hypothetical protein ACFSR7_13620 [Cohnella sp. GCM10020058]|uniref:hypothetical protein n=1 Tax=Cohnella sp. GCM10020058 TaxID=3317330 RepID=UPI0036398446
MGSRITDESLRQDALFARLRETPLTERRRPGERVVADILASAGQRGSAAKHFRRRWAIGVIAALAVMLLAAGLGYAYEAPGGFADRRLSKAMGLNGSTLLIPIGWTPEEAVEKFRRFDTMRVVHREAVDGGVLLFIKRNMQPNGTELQVEFVRRTWLGWKWGMGGGYGIGYGEPGEAGVRSLLNYMTMPNKYPGVPGPYPLVVGELTDASVTGVIVKTSGTKPGNYAADVVEYEPGKRIWFVLLPDFAELPYTVQALDEQGNIAAEKTLKDPVNDTGDIRTSADR